MGISSRQLADARCRTEQGCANDTRAAQARLRHSRSPRYVAHLIVVLLWPCIGAAETLRIATYAAPLSRDGPGLLWRDILRSDDAQIAAITDVIVHIAPDVLLLTDFDYDLDSAALAAFAAVLDARGHTLEHHFALRPNTGLASGHDLDGNGRLGEARDAQGYGRFSGDGGMAILSVLPIDTDNVRDLSDLLWRDVPGATLPDTMTPQVKAVQRLSTSGHWIVPLITDHGPLTLMTYAATPPVFDGPEDRNGLRNRDELRLWSLVLDGAYGTAPEDFIVLGNANLDPVDGQGYADAMAAFLADPRIQDPQPRSVGADLPSQHAGDSSVDTANWLEDGPGNLRVSYVLPAATLNVTGAGVFWPAPDAPKATLLGDDGLAAGVHHLVWVDISW